MSQIHELLTDQIGSPKCFCGNEQGFKLRQKNHTNGWHVGLHCGTCGTWLKWVSQIQIKKEAQVEKEMVQESLW